MAKKNEPTVYKKNELTHQQFASDATAYIW